jgi:hypothetical protein
MCDMVVYWAAFNAFLCMSAMHRTNYAAVRHLRTKKEGHRKIGALIGMKVKNLQRGTANAVELGGKATVCIS